jgi:sulfate permease, SulP family
MAHVWYKPELIASLAAGYGARRALADLNAGFAVAILALPLSLAIAIAAGLSPASGVVTAIIGGAIISAFGGTKHQIGGPAAAFIVVVAGVVAAHGLEGLLIATIAAGALLIVAAALKFGRFVHLIPHAVVTGFMSGIGVLIALTQIKDFVGIESAIPAATLAKLQALWAHRGETKLSAIVVCLVTMAVMIYLRKRAPRFPGLVAAVVVGSIVAALIGNVATIQSRFGALPAALPAPHLPQIDLAKLVTLLPTILMLTFLIGVEGLLSALIADQQAKARDRTHTPHNPNAELFAQGLANMAAPLFGGIPATGVIARTATNIAAGAETPVAGVIHALIVAIALFFLAPLAGQLALPCLAGVLLVTAWRLMEIKEVEHALASGSLRDRACLIVTWLLTVFWSLEIAIAAGLLTAYLLKGSAASRDAH